MGDPLQQKLDQILAELNTLNTDVATVQGNLITVKGDHDRLTVAVNHLQPKKLEIGNTSGSKHDDVDNPKMDGAGGSILLVVAQHSLVFPHYDGQSL
uniref:Uncharacterized protein n=1 Tax=Arundo donax TaxID=35708 RepID=A0A0A8ZAK6_ARUDO